MIALVRAGILMAQTNRVDEMARRMADGFREDPVRFDGGIGWLLVLILVGLLPAVWLLGRLTGRGREEIPRNDPGRLFAGLCRAHGLSWSDRRFLRRLARSQGLEDPACLFVEPDWFDASGLDGGPHDWGRRGQAIRNRLFAGLTKEDFEPGPGHGLSDPIPQTAATTRGTTPKPDVPPVSTSR